MKSMIMYAVAGLLVATSLASLAAEGDTPRRGERGPRPDGPRMRPPLIAALDANQDGVIDAAEIDNATAALKKLDKNGDGKLTREELMPPRPPREGKGQARKGDKPQE